MILLIEQGDDRFTFRADRLEERTTANRTLLRPYLDGEQYGEVDLTQAKVTILPDPS